MNFCKEHSKQYFIKDVDRMTCKIVIIHNMYSGMTTKNAKTVLSKYTVYLSTDGITICMPSTAVERKGINSNSKPFKIPTKAQIKATRV